MSGGALPLVSGTWRPKKILGPVDAWYTFWHFVATDAVCLIQAPSVLGHGAGTPSLTHCCDDENY